MATPTPSSCATSPSNSSSSPPESTPRSGFIARFAHRGGRFSTAAIKRFHGKYRSKTITLTSCSRDINEQDQNVLTVDLDVCQADGNIRGHTSRDVAAIKLGTLLTNDRSNFSFAFVGGVVATSYSVGGLVAVNVKDTVKRFDEVMIANDVYIFGYPSSLRLTPIPQLDHSRPLLRKGIVAGKNVQRRTLILDCPVFPGNSGGLALEVEQNRLRAIGVVIEYVPCQVQMTLPGIGAAGNSGYSVVEPMDHVLELIANW